MKLDSIFFFLHKQHTCYKWTLTVLF